MKSIKISRLLLAVLFSALIILSCQKGKIDPYYKQFIFFADYKKPSLNISDAKFVIDFNTLPRQIQLPSTQNPNPAACQTNRTCIMINNVRLKDELGIYDIADQTDVVTEEMRNGIWEQDVENKLTLTKAQNLDIVLVLDYSSSLGQDIVKVKEYAVTFVNYIKNQNTGAKVGLVTFSNTVNYLPLTNNFNTAISFINTQPAGADETKLYEAMDKGTSLLQNSTADGKAVITFTDGKNNSWSNPIYQNYDPVVSKLTAGAVNPATTIASYTIGLNGKQGAVDAAALSRLAMNGGISAIAPDTDELEKLFKKFASSVSAVYTMTYSRNNSIITDFIKLRFVINTQLQ